MINGWLVVWAAICRVFGGWGVASNKGTAAESQGD
jgi:hypothetical protein